MAQSKKVLVTGGTGFIGSHTVVALHEAIYEPYEGQLRVKEHHLYGSSRLGVVKPHEETEVEAISTPQGGADSTRYNRYLGHKYYELTNHLGNVLVTISGHKVMQEEEEHQWAFGFEPGEDNIFDDDRHLQLLSTAAAHNGDYSIYQDYSAGGEWGPRVNIHVHAGDVVTSTIYGLTENSNITQSGVIVRTLIDAGGTLLYLDQNGQSPAWIADGWFDNINWTQRGFTNYTIPNNLYDANGTAADMDEIHLFVYTAVPSGEGPTYFDDILIDIQWATPITSYLADVVSYSDYYSFGMQMPGRNGSTGEYRYGFNGMEKDDEVKGGGNSYTTTERFYDPRIGRWMKPDLLEAEAPSWTPYRYAFDNPLRFSDPDGTFEIDETTAENYPKLNAYLQNISKVYAEKPEAFRKAFKEYSQLSDEQINKMLEYKLVKNGTDVVPNQSNPRIKIRKMTDANGTTPATLISNSRGGLNSVTDGVIYLNENIVDNFEEDHSTTMEREGARVLIESTIFHEGTHYGDFLDGSTDKTPMGLVHGQPTETGSEGGGGFREGRIW